MNKDTPRWHFLILGAPIYECQEKEYTAEEVAVARSITLAASSEPLTRESLAEAKGRLAAAGAMRSSNAANTDEQQAGGAKASAAGAFTPDSTPKTVLARLIEEPSWQLRRSAQQWCKKSLPLLEALPMPFRWKRNGSRKKKLSFAESFQQLQVSLK